jgi:heme oxygenase
MDETHALQYALCIAGALLTVIWAMLRHEAKKTEDALEKKASCIEVAEAKANHAVALKDVKDHFQKIIDRNHDDYRERIHELNERQDREVDWLKQELSKLGDNIQVMRQEQSTANSQHAAANAAIMQNIQQLSTMLQRSAK